MILICCLVYVVLVVSVGITLAQLLHPYYFSFSCIFMSCHESDLLACACCACRIRWHGIALPNLPTGRAIYYGCPVVCDHTACISRERTISNNTGCTGCRRVQRTVPCETTQTTPHCSRNTPMVLLLPSTTVPLST